MGPRHNPEFRDALPPISSRRLDGRATDVITRQQTRLEEQTGDPNEAVIPGQEDERLYGYNFELSNGRSVELEIDTDAEGEPTGPDVEFVDARNRLAVLRSRERSRGSRMFNFAFMRNRGRGPGGHGYQHSRIQREYDAELSSFVARKVDSLGLNNEDLVTEAVSRSVIQEQKQMSALENVAAEQKSGNRVLNFFRNHKKTRIAAGLALSGIGALGIATGQLEIAIPALAARSALSGTGGYLLGRTAWDGFQGWRARRLPHEDIRMARGNDGDFSGHLTPKAAFERLIKLHGAEARAGSHDSRRQDLIHALGSRLVHEYYTGHLDFSTGHGSDEIRDQVTSLHRRFINRLQEKRLKSDQTQSRRRHIAGIAGGVAMAALPMARMTGLIEVGIGGGGSHDAATHAAGHGGTPEAPDANSSAYHPGNTGGVGKPGGTYSSYESGGTTADGSSYTSYIDGSPRTLPEITINGGPGNDTIILAALHESGGHNLGAHSLHETLEGISTSELHVESGGGFISTLQEQYDLSPAQADTAYHAMYSHLAGAPGTYMEGSDIRISSPGGFKLPGSARAILEERLKALHEMPGHLHAGVGDATAVTDAKTGLVDPKTGGVIAPESAAHGQDNIGNGGTTAPTTAAETAKGIPDVSGDITINGGTGSDRIQMMLPGADTLQGQELQSLIDGHHVAETGLKGLTDEQAAHAQTLIGQYVNNGGFSGLSPKAKAAAERAIETYAQASIDHPGEGTTAHEAANRIRHILMAIGHDIHNLNLNQAKTLEENLAIANAG